MFSFPSKAFLFFCFTLFVRICFVREKVPILVLDASLLLLYIAFKLMQESGHLELAFEVSECMDS